MHDIHFSESRVCAAFVSCDCEECQRRAASAAAIGLPGVYNQNGIVDAADYTVWRNNLGGSTSLPNDDSPGVGQDDYNAWRTHFGQTAGSGFSTAAIAAVPEPSTLAMLVLAAMGVCSCRRRAHRKSRKLINA